MHVCFLDGRRHRIICYPYEDAEDEESGESATVDSSVCAPKGRSMQCTRGVAASALPSGHVYRVCARPLLARSSCATASPTPSFVRFKPHGFRVHTSLLARKPIRRAFWGLLIPCHSALSIAARSRHAPPLALTTARSNFPAPSAETHAHTHTRSTQQALRTCARLRGHP